MREKSKKSLESCYPDNYREWQKIKKTISDEKTFNHSNIFI